jgi:hypothetical protein
VNAQVRKARKRPVDIEYMVWPGGAANATPVIDWVLSHSGTATYAEVDEAIPERLRIRTLEGQMLASPGDIIIRGVAGEFYPCKPEIFRETYDIITEED